MRSQSSTNLAMRVCSTSRPAWRKLSPMVSSFLRHSQWPMREETRARVSGVEAEGFADFAGGGFSAVGDDVGGHGGAELAVALVDVLDGLLALVAGGQVEVDVGPLVAVFVEEALEEEVHADGVDGGDLEGVADDGVGGAAAALDEDVVVFAEADDVPDDEEVAGEAEFFDEGELVFGLEFCLVEEAGSRLGP